MHVTQNEICWATVTQKELYSYSEAYSEPCQTSKIEFFATVLDVWQASEYASDIWEYTL